MVGAEKRCKKKSGEQEGINKEMIKERRENKGKGRACGIKKDGWLRG